MSKVNGFVFLVGSLVSIALLTSGCAGSAFAQTNNEVPSIHPGDPRLQIPDFEPYQAEYTSAFGRFVNQVRHYRGEDGPKISILNIISMPQGVIVDHRGVDAATQRIEFFHSPYFAWGPEYVVAAANEEGYDWVRVPLGGGEPVRAQGQMDTPGYFDSIGFSPLFGALMPMDVGSNFTLPREQPRASGEVSIELVEFEVLRREHLELSSGLNCECWVIEERTAGGSVTQLWVSRQAPFVFRRHRDIGGPREFISDLLEFSPL